MSEIRKRIKNSETAILKKVYALYDENDPQPVDKYEEYDKIIILIICAVFGALASLIF